MAACSLCGASIMWAKTEDGASIPLALPPTPRGNAWLEPDPNDAQKKVVVISSKDRPKPADVRSYLPHFVDCVGYAAKKRIEKAFKTAAKETS